LSKTAGTQSIIAVPFQMSGGSVTPNASGTIRFTGGSGAGSLALGTFNLNAASSVIDFGGTGVFQLQGNSMPTISGSAGVLKLSDTAVIKLGGGFLNAINIQQDGGTWRGGGNFPGGAIT